MLSLAIFGGNHVDGSMLDPGERVVALALFGGIDFDFASTPPPPGVEVVSIAVFGGVSFKVRSHQPVRLSGVSIFGGRSVEPLQLPPQAAPPSHDPDDDIDLPLDISVYSLFGGVNVKRIDEQRLTAADAVVR